MLPTAHTRLLTLALEAGMLCRFRIKRNGDDSAELRLRVETARGERFGWATPLDSARSATALVSAIDTAAAHAMEHLFPDSIYFVRSNEKEIVPGDRQSIGIRNVRASRQ